MKKLLKLLPLLLIAVVGLTLSSCGDDDEKEIAKKDLPATATAFISQYWPDASIISSRQDGNEYEVILSEGTRIDFNKEGEWLDVDAQLGRTVPTGFYPEAIDNYIASNFSGAGINEISKETAGYEVKLLTGTELLFSYEGVYIGIDR